MVRKLRIGLAAGIAAVFALVTIGTLAYFHDTDDAENIFTVGNIAITLHESNGEGAVDEAYQDWLSEQILMPGVSIAKSVTVENTGSNPAYVRVKIAVPSAIEPENLLLGYGQTVQPGGQWELLNTVGTITRDGKSYRVYTVEYTAALAAGQTTSPVLQNVKLANAVEISDILRFKEAGAITPQGQLRIFVMAEAIQTASFSGSEEAFLALDADL